MAASDTVSEKFSFLKDVYVSVVFLTRLPAPGWPDAAARKLSTGMWAFPIAGILIATIAGVVYALCDAMELPVYISALFAVVALIIATGGLHEDGLSDLADGIWGGSDADKRLAIMSDSRIGAYGAIALIVSVTGRAAAIATIGEPVFVFGALVAAAAVSRAVMPAVMTFGTPAKTDGLGVSAGAPAFAAWGGAWRLVCLPGRGRYRRGADRLVRAAQPGRLYRRRARRRPAGRGTVRPDSNRERHRASRLTNPTRHPSPPK